MSRKTGDFNFSANFELKKEGTLDARQFVDTFADLLNFTSSNFIANGFPVTVRTDSNYSGTFKSKGIYQCVDNQNLSLASSWEKIGGSSLSDAEIKTAYENNTNTNAFTNSEKTKLGNQSGINTGDQIQESTVIVLQVDNLTKVDVVTAFNTMPDIDIDDISNVKIKAVLRITDANPNAETAIYSLISNLKNAAYDPLVNGSYGNTGYQITDKHLLIDYKKVSTSQDIAQVANQVVDLTGTNITTDIVNYINNTLSTVYTLADSAVSTTLIKTLQNSNAVDYLYIGAGQDIGNTSSPNIALTDLSVIEQEENQIQLYWEPVITITGQRVLQIKPANNRVVSGTHLKDNSTPETKLTQNVRDKIRRPTVEITTTTYQFQAIDDKRFLLFTQPCTCVIPNGLSADLEFQGIGGIVVNAESGGTLNYSGAFINETFDANSFFGIRTMGSDVSKLTGTLKLS